MGVFSEKLRLIRALIDERDRRYEREFLCQREAVDLASRDLDRRLEGMNQFREQLEKQAKDFLSRSEYRVAHTALESKNEAVSAAILTRVSALERNDATIGGAKLAGAQNWSTLLGIASIVVAMTGLLALVIHTFFGH